MDDFNQRIQNNDHNTKPKLARLPRVLDIIGNSRSWVYQEIANDRFPKPISLGKRNVAWIEQEIFDWVDQQIKESREKKEHTS